MFYSNFVPKCTVFKIFDFKICRDLEMRVKGHSRSSEVIRIHPPPMTSILTYIITMSLSRTVSEIDGDFRRKSPIFPPRVFIAPLKGLLLELDIGAGVRKN